MTITNQPLNVLVACEFSGTVRRAWADRGHNAWSCDLIPSLDDSPNHIIGDARELLSGDWDLLLVAHPPCTRLCNSGVRWLTKPPKGKTLEQMWNELQEGADLFADFLNCDIKYKCIENPVMHKHAKKAIRNYREFTQSVQPWQYGHGETKRTCLWLDALPPLTPTDIVDGRASRVHHASPGPNRWKERSKFFSGIADAMVDQWASTVAMGA